MLKAEVHKDVPSYPEIIKLMNEVSQSISLTNGGLTNFEFVNSGLLESIYEFFTYVPSIDQQ